MKDNYNISAKEMKDVVKQARNTTRKDVQDYGYYSKVLKEPFDSIEELKEAEEAYYAKLKAKEDQAAAKKAEAKKVEDAFIALNAARKIYKDDLTALVTEYSDTLKELKDAFEFGKKDIHAKLAAAEDAYVAALKAFTDKYPEGYHLTLKDGDFETTISNTVSTGAKTDPSTIKNIPELFEYLFSF